MARDRFAYDLAEIGSQSQVPALVELRLIQAGPASVDFAALHRSTQNKHHVSVPVVGASIAVLARSAAEF